MKNVPILKLAGQFSMLQEIIRIVGATVPGLIDGKGFIDEYASFSDSFFQTGEQWPMKVAENQYGPVVVHFKRI